MQPNVAFSEDAQLMLSSLQKSGEETVDKNEVEEDEFDRLLTVTMDKSGLCDLESQLGLAGGGDWWLDASRPPLEINSQGDFDNNAILDMEADVRTWLRVPFDTDPEFCHDSYHLLNRLTELARLKGLVEEASLKHDSTYKQNIYHSTLSVSAFGDSCYLSRNDSQNVDPVFALRRSLDGPLILTKDIGTYGVRKPENLKQLDALKPPLREINSATIHSKKTNIPYPPPKLTGLPQLHHSKQTPPRSAPNKFNEKSLPSQNQASHPATDFNGLLPVPDATSSPHNRNGPLSRTYSKEALDVLKEVNGIEKLRASDSAPNFHLKNRADFNPLANSLPEVGSDADITKSLDTVNTGNPLSLSYTLTSKSRKLSDKLNISYSSMRSSDVYEMARLQEHHLREHSGSRSKLGGSNSSLTGSLLGDDQKSTSDLGSSEKIATRDREYNHSPLSQDLKPERQIAILVERPCNITASYELSDGNRAYDAPANEDLIQNLDYEPPTPLFDPTSNHLTAASYDLDKITASNEDHLQQHVIFNRSNSSGNVSDVDNLEVVIEKHSDQTINVTEYTKSLKDSTDVFPLDFLTELPEADETNDLNPISIIPSIEQREVLSKTASKPKVISNIKSITKNSVAPTSKIAIPISSSRLPVLSQKLPSRSIHTKPDSTNVVNESRLRQPEIKLNETSSHLHPSQEFVPYDTRKIPTNRFGTYTKSGMSNFSLKSVQSTKLDPTSSRQISSSTRTSSNESRIPKPH